MLIFKHAPQYNTHTLHAPPNSSKNVHKGEDGGNIKKTEIELIIASIFIPQTSNITERNTSPSRITNRKRIKLSTVVAAAKMTMDVCRIATLRSFFIASNASLPARDCDCDWGDEMGGRGGWLGRGSSAIIGVLATTGGGLLLVLLIFVPAEPCSAPGGIVEVIGGGLGMEAPLASTVIL